MILKGDYHTHTIFSHGTGTIEDNVKVAVKKGLKQIAITDHGFNHKLYGVRRIDIPLMRKQIEQLKKDYPIEILLGIESNLIGENGTIDILKEEEKLFDLIIMGYHKIVTAQSINDRFGFFARNDFRKIFSSKWVIQKNTDAYLRAIDMYNIDILAHLNYGMPVDAPQIAKLANQKGTLIELNGKRTLFSQDDIDKMVDMKTKFIMDSDAHAPENVGEVNHPMNFAIMHQIPKELIVNIDGTPLFKKHKG